MLTFLRKHQKIFFIFITATIIISFTFFGTYSTFNNRTEVEDKPLFSGVCGKPIMQQELAALCRLIENSPFERSEKGNMPNFLNDGVIEKDFFSTGLGMMLAKRYFAELKPDLDQRLKRIQSYRAYVHPRSPQINAEVMWNRFSPELSQHLRSIKLKSDQLTTETLALMMQLYLDQVRLPPDILKQVLTMQQNQMNIEPDPLLTHGDLSLFGFKSIDDWFGPHFVPLIAQFIENAAQLAVEKGYDVKKEEIRADLYQNIYQGYQQHSREGKLASEEVEYYFQTKMRGLGFDEKMLLCAWKKVMLMRRLFEDGSGSILVDGLAYQQFDKFAKESVQVSLYQLPQALQLTDFRSMLKLQVYLEGVAADISRLRSDLRIPKQFASIEAIERKAPELIERSCELQWSSVTKEELSQSISVKETWDWETLDAHWQQLKKQFPEVALLKGESKSERQAGLETLDKKLRIKVDQFARGKMIDEHPEHIAAALDRASPQTSTVGLKLRGTQWPFDGVKENSELAVLVEHADSKLNNYSPDGEHYYRIQVVRQEPKKKILTFEEAYKDGTLDRLLDKRLEEAYPEMRKKDFAYFQQSGGQWKPFNDVKDQIGKHLFADLLRSIEDHYRVQFGLLPGKAGDLPLAFYSNTRLLVHMNDAKSQLHTNPTAWLKTSSDAPSISSQWLLEKSEQSVERCGEIPFSKEEMFLLSPNEWSPVTIGDHGALAFYFVQGKQENRKPSLNGMEQGHQILAFDAKRDMMLQILQKIQEKKAIDLTALNSEERR